MQQLQNTYGGDRSDTLATILGLDYDPQGYMAQMANNMLQTGMSSSTSLKTAAMAQNAADNRQFVQNQMDMNKARRDQTMIRNAAGAKLRGQQQGAMRTLGMYLDMLDQYPDDQYMQDEARALRSQMSGLQGAFSQPGTLEEQVGRMEQIMGAGMADYTTAGGVAGLADYGRRRRDFEQKQAEATKKKQEEEAKAEQERKKRAEDEKAENEVVDLGDY